MASLCEKRLLLAGAGLTEATPPLRCLEVSLKSLPSG